jgi:hypothetical protein
MVRPFQQHLRYSPLIFHFDFSILILEVGAAKKQKYPSWFSGHILLKIMNQRQSKRKNELALSQALILADISQSVKFPPHRPKQPIQSEGLTFALTKVRPSRASQFRALKHYSNHFD